MNNLHVVVNFVRGEDPHTPPTDVYLTLRTSHMVAASVLLDKDLALWALLDVLITLSPTPQLSLLLPLLTAESVVILPTGNAKNRETRLTMENATAGFRFESVDFETVGGGTVSELIRMVTEVFEEGNVQQAFELSGKEESLYDGKRDWDTTLPFIAHTRQGKSFGVGGGEKEVTKAPMTINVATGEAIRLVDCVETNRTTFTVLELVLRSNGIRQRLVNEFIQTMTCGFASTDDDLARGR